MVSVLISIWSVVGGRCSMVNGWSVVGGSFYLVLTKGEKSLIEKSL